jgi:hypothetical protein
MKIRWWLRTRDANVASVRLRCLNVIEALQKRGIDAAIYEPTAPDPDVLVLSKRYDKASIAHATSVRSRSGAKLVLDLCDNHFYSASGDAEWQRTSSALRQAVADADLVVASSDELRRVIEAEVRQHPPIEVIGDAVEGPADEPGLGQRLRHAVHEVRLWQLARRLDADGVALARRAVWFGHHGSPNAEAGMSDLLRVRAPLAAEAQHGPLSLTVISNSWEKFVQLRSNWPTPIHYLPWHRSTITRALHLHGVALIPVQPNPFTRCKTSNRVATALLHGLAVVADRIPSYEEFDRFVHLDDWSNGLPAALRGFATSKAQVDAGAAYVRQHFSVDTITGCWLAALVQAACMPQQSYRPAPAD